MLRGQLNALGAGRGSVVLVTGPAGSGKTTLLAEAASLAADGGILVFCGGGDPTALAVPLGAILDALVSTDDPPVDLARLHELSQSPDQRFWLLRELQESLEKATHRAPLLVVVDDLQWADAASASALVTLSRRLATHRISWLLALRRGELADAAQDAVDRLEAAGAAEIRLGPLDETAVAQVARDMLGGEPDEALREVLSRADGQPFLLQLSDHQTPRRVAHCPPGWRPYRPRPARRPRARVRARLQPGRPLRRGRTGEAAAGGRAAAGRRLRRRAAGERRGRESELSWAARRRAARARAP